MRYPFLVARHVCEGSVYECISHGHGYYDHRMYYEHRIDDKRVVVRGQENGLSFSGFPFVPNQNSDWSPWQVSELIKHDILVETDQPFVLPSAPISLAEPPSFIFVHADFMKTEGFMDRLDTLFKGPSGYKFSTFNEHATMAHLMHRVGIFSSIGDARRNGWNKPIPSGYTEHTVTKRRISVDILNIYDGWDDPIEED